MLLAELRNGRVIDERSARKRHEIVSLPAETSSPASRFAVSSPPSLCRSMTTLGQCEVAHCIAKTNRCNCSLFKWAFTAVWLCYAIMTALRQWTWCIRPVRRDTHDCSNWISFLSSGFVGADPNWSCFRAMDDAWPCRSQYTFIHSRTRSLFIYYKMIVDKYRVYILVFFAQTTTDSCHTMWLSYDRSVV